MGLAGIGFVTGGFLVAASASFVVVMPSPSYASSVVVAESSSSGSSGAPPPPAPAGGPSASSSRYFCRWIDESGTVSHETAEEARSCMTGYLFDNIMPYDVPISRTLGFDPPPPPLVGSRSTVILRVVEEASTRIALEINDQRPTTAAEEAVVGAATATARVDGLEDGIVNGTVSYSLLAKDLYAWTDLIPKSVYLEYVVPYAVVNEPRTDHRPLLFRALRDDLRGYERSSSTENNNANPPREQLKEVVKLINTRLWSILGKSPTEPIVFVSGQTPRIMDPLSVIAYGHSSCTGLAIVLIAALRSVGIPARMAGTPAWHGNDDEGNHSWVEVYVPPSSSSSSSSDGGDDEGGEWIFLEPSPGIKEGDTETANSDDLDRDPRARWFCTPDRMDGSTRVYATRYARGGGGASAQRHYPMPWSDADADDGVPGVDRTGYYAAACGPTSSYA